ncbi:membrane-bound metal-dependent hydrolase [Methanolacinia petrolearia DSM 11571]|uniref:Membrane-bound metal-dependent hydrolase n=1 Tax=Methanolacinia petrolearia (strain DSM 11571 / OCM 486 / SEBR 4847) TaxID=679926 RepID=E1RF08_METP4|nr:metal-dependent hydrolase [Methanolacinia petrolearia]ADN37252.1 membrane-bound metal-dependent hydrolase [Methanolacinia petrolearia DSM 11571]
MDILTHAFSVIFLGGNLDIFLVCFGVVGTILPDMDILMHRLSGRDPLLYIFSHGGITHSIAGSILIAIVAFSSICLMQLAGILSLPSDPGFWISGLGMIVGGALLHITLDYLAYPGIPLFFPLSDKKYTLGIFPGPSLFLTIASVVFLILLILGFAGAADIYLWGIVFLGIIIFSLIKKGLVAGRFRGKETIPTFHPLHWIIVSEDDREYTISRYSITGGVYGESAYKKSESVGEEEIEALADDPEMKRLRYSSYLVVFERSEGKIRAYDPLRVSGLMFYPPDYREYVAELPES